MTVDETKVILGLMAGIWSSFTADDAKAEIWQKVIGDIGFKHVQNAIYILANTEVSGFAPTPGQIRAVVANKNNPHITKTAQEAWIDVQNVVKKYSYNYNQEKCITEIKKLGETAAKAVQSIGYHQLWNCDIETDLKFIQRDFINAYNAYNEREIEFARLPEHIKQQMVGCGSGRMLVEYGE